MGTMRLNSSTLRKGGTVSKYLFLRFHIEFEADLRDDFIFPFRDKEITQT